MSRPSAQRVARRNRTAASFKNMRVYVDLRGSKLILDFRGGSGQSKMAVPLIQKKSKEFGHLVRDTEGGGPLQGGKTIDEAVESYKDIGFLVSRLYNWDVIIRAALDYETLEKGDWQNDFANYGPEHFEGQALDTVEDWLSQQGWKVTRK
jgi:hypothetical protein